jgi:dCMP deaminase
VKQERPSPEALMLDFLILWRQRSTCKRAQQACIVTNAKHTQILAFGYNGRAAGESHDGCDPANVGNCGCVHAEMNALIKMPYTSEDCILYCTMSPCKLCARLIVNKGNISTVKYIQVYRDPEPIKILQAAGIKQEWKGVCDTNNTEEKGAEK